ncbi:MAG TPA: GNAT family N-acetyltransferase [Armatimonadota bacterium]|nr:GNAT family N-acetyltransferase [Armatimonadota bacterium]
MADDITIHSLAETERTPAELAQLFNTAFGEYEGVVYFTPETMAWYLARPGLGSEHTFVALAGDQLIGGVMVTCAPVVLGGEPISCGIIDSVMTLPTWRRRGVATRLMEHALAWMREAGLESSLLFTVPHSNGYRIYSRLGYIERATVSYYFALPAPQGEADPRLRAAVPGEEERVRVLLNTWLRESDGFVPVDPVLWRWRREERPHELPCSLFVLEDAGQIRATGAVCTTRVQLDGRPLDLVVLTDIAGDSPDAREAMVRALLRRVPPGFGVGMLAGSYDPVLLALGEKLGMSCQNEVAMVIPFGPRAEELLDRQPAGWYTLAESLIGV